MLLMLWGVSTAQSEEYSINTQSSLLMPTLQSDIAKFIEPCMKFEQGKLNIYDPLEEARKKLALEKAYIKGIRDEMQTLCELYLIDANVDICDKVNRDETLNTLRMAKHDPASFHWLLGDSIARIQGNGLTDVVYITEILIKELPEEKRGKYTQQLHSCFNSNERCRVLSSVLERLVLIQYNDALYGKKVVNLTKEYETKVNDVLAEPLIPPPFFEHSKQFITYYLNKTPWESALAGAIALVVGYYLLCSIKANLSKRSIIFAANIITILLILSLGEMPHGFYLFLRIIVAIYCAYSILIIPETKAKNVLLLLAISLAVLYQPLVKISMDKEIWSIVNVATIPCLYIFHSTSFQLSDAAKNTAKKVCKQLFITVGSCCLIALCVNICASSPVLPYEQQFYASRAVKLKTLKSECDKAISLALKEEFEIKLQTWLPQIIQQLPPSK